MSMTRLLRSDQAENSIMQTISIAVSAILIASGLVTAPGLINNARDNNARTDLANIAYAQEFVMSVGGKYQQYINKADEEAKTGAASTGNNLLDKAMSLGADGAATSVGNSNGGVKFTLSGSVTGHAAQTCDDPSYFILKDQSSSGKWFYRGSGSGLVSTDFNEILLGIPADVRNACPDLGVGFDETPTDNPSNPTDPSDDGDVFAGAAILPVDVNSKLYMNSDGSPNAFEISGYGQITSQTIERFGGGTSWAPALGDSVSWSYVQQNDNNGLELVPFYEAKDDTSTEFADNEIKTKYDAASGYLFGNGYAAVPNDSKVLEGFQKVSTQGGAASFIDGRTGAKVDIVWAPSTGNTPEYQNPKFPSDPNQPVAEPVYETTYSNIWTQTLSSNRTMHSAKTNRIYTSPDGRIVLFRANNGTLYQNYISRDYGQNYDSVGVGGECVRKSSHISNSGIVINDGLKVACDFNEASYNINRLLPMVDTDDFQAGSDGIATKQLFSNVTVSDDDQTIAIQGYREDGTSFIFVSHDAGQTGTEYTKPGNWADSNSSFRNQMWMSGDGNTIVAQADSKLFVSNDTGATGNLVDVPDGYDKTQMSVAISDNGQHIVVGASNGKVGISHDGGNSFTWAAPTDLGVSPTNDIISAVISDDGQRIVVLENIGQGLFMSADGGKTWMQDRTGNYSEDSQLFGNSDLSEVHFLWNHYDSRPTISFWKWGDVRSYTNCVENCPVSEEPQAS